MENNNSKQAILSIVGIAILVIAVVGVSFAFFTYSRTGAKNNVITTGSITFELQPGGPEGTDHPTITGENSFPKPDDKGSTDAVNETDFTVTGDLPDGANPVKYVVYAIKGDAPKVDGGETAPVPSGIEGAEWGVLPNAAIKMLLAVDKGEGGTIDEEPYKAAANPIDFTVNTGDGTMGFVLAKGTITAGTEINHKYTLHMWITDTYNSGKIISDTDAEYAYRASSTSVGDLPAGKDKVSNLDERPIWTDQYYAVKIKVVASDDPNFNKGA